MENKKHNYLNLMFLFHYKYSRRKNNPPLYAMFDAILYFDLPFMLLVIDSHFFVHKLFNIKTPLNMISNFNFWSLLFYIAIPLAIILKFITYNRKVIENIDLSESDYKKGKKIYFIFLLIVALLSLIPPFIFGGSS